MYPRYAIYFAPPSTSQLWEAGVRWLGRDPECDCAVAQPRVQGWSAERLQQLTASPRLYGFHATLKPPFALRADCDADELRAELARFAANRRSFVLPPLEVGTLSSFLALRPVLESDQLNALARDCVTGLDRLRAPAAADELASRRRFGLTARQDVLLLRYGYPYVLEEFRFHLTLTERLDAIEGAGLRGPLFEHFSAALRQPARVDAVCLFEQDRPGTAFRLTHRYAFGAP